MKLALEYGFFCQSFWDGLTPEEKILADHHILNRIVQAENDAQKKALEKSKDAREHPGMERFESLDEFWDEAEDANQEV